ncbi:MAG: pseudouridine-5'-phosphate glycosidase [Thermoanaerobaculia bacterium]|nr:pseudouridine-5'-phosphate glycosidase [Thermoanaerobaculia bacterium]
MDVRPRVRERLERGEPVVALESTVIAHGLPRPLNLETALRLEETVRGAGAEPATVGLLDGRLVVGLSRGEIERLATSEGAAKVSRRDLAAVVASGAPGATTVAATVYAAGRAGIRCMATGGIGGVHRGGETTLDVSADLTELARTPVAVVCAGAKSVLDLERTLEVLETLGVPVVGFGTDELPAFYAAGSGLPLPHRVDDAEAAARLLAAQWLDLEMPGGVVFAVPPPAEKALGREEVEKMVARAAGEAERAGVRGRDLTPYLLRKMADDGGGRVVAVNVALLERNARVAAEIAGVLAREEGGARRP